MKKTCYAVIILSLVFMTLKTLSKDMYANEGDRGCSIQDKNFVSYNKPLEYRIDKFTYDIVKKRAESLGKFFDGDLFRFDVVPYDVNCKMKNGINEICWQYDRPSFTVGVTHNYISERIEVGGLFFF